MGSPTQRTLKLLRERGWHAGVVERFYAGTRHDLFGFVDIVAVREDDRLPLWVQTCSGTDHAKRAAKIVAQPAFKACCCAGIVVVISWSKRGAKGKRKLWTPRLVEVWPTGEPIARDPSVFLGEVGGVVQTADSEGLPSLEG